MRKTVLIFILLAGVSLQSEAQKFIASFGVQHTWGVPVHVTRVVHDHYRGYDWVHASRIRRNGGIFFDLVLQHNGVFIEVSVRHDGHISRRVIREYYPLHDHVCHNHCGFHNSYYNAHYSACHSSHHYGHNHVVYVKRPHGHAYGYYKKHFSHASKGYYKEHYYEDKRFERDWEKDYERERDSKRYRNGRNSYRERRDRYFVTNKHYDRRENDTYHHKGRSDERADRGRGNSHVQRRR